MVILSRDSVSGSSPLARGTSQLLGMARTPRRLIPARAGNIDQMPRRSRLNSAHPRSRGEHAATRDAESSRVGSSPLARGTYCRRIPRRGARRLIPARAGNMLWRGVKRLATAAHPRSRGEHQAVTSERLKTRGSSPLARGTSVLLLEGGFSVRLIPARAGNILADMGFYSLHQQNRITLEPEPASRIHDKQ